MPAALFLLTYLGGIVAAFARWPIAVLGIYMLAFYAHPPSRWWGSILPDWRWSFVAAITAVIISLKYKSKISSDVKPWHKDTIVVTSALFVLWMWMQTPWAVGYADHVAGVTVMTKCLLVAYTMIKLMDSADTLDFVCVVHVVGCAYLGELAREMGTGSERLDGVGGPGIDDANTLGMQFATAALIGVVQVMSGPVWKRLLVVMSLPFVLNGLVLTQSRGAFLGLAMGGVALYMLGPKKHRKSLLAMALGATLLLSLVAHKDFWDRMQTITSDDSARDQSAQSRFIIAGAQLRMFADYPMGTGHRGTASLSRQYIPEEYLSKRGDESSWARSSHNTFLTILVEQGVFGVLIYSVLLIATARRIWSLRSLSNDSPERSRVMFVAAGIGGALVCVFVSGQFTDYLRAEVLIWLYAWTVAVSRIARSDLPATEAAVPLPTVDPQARRFAQK